MKILPATGSDWFALFLLPFKVFVPAGWLLLAVKRGLIGYRMDTSLELSSFVLESYAVCFLVLTVGAVVQRGFGAREASRSTCWFIMALFFFGYLTLPYLAHT